MGAVAKNIVFDWNSTLLDDIDALHSCTNRLLVSEGHPSMTIDHFREHYTIPFESLYRNMGFDDRQIERLLSLENTAFHDHYEPMVERAALREGAIELLNHAKAHGVKTYILSNHIVEPIRTQLRRLEIDSLFVEVLAYADRATQFRDMTKGERLRRYMNAQNMQASQTLIIGDSVEEIEIAREQGLISVAITGGCVSENRLRAATPDYLIHSLVEIKDILRTRGFIS